MQNPTYAAQRYPKVDPIVDCYNSKHLLAFRSLQMHIKNSIKCFIEINKWIDIDIWIKMH